MITFEVQVGLIITPEHDGDDLDTFTDRMIEELANLADEVDLGGSVTTGDFLISVTVTAETPIEALQQGCVLIKTAAHAAGGQTAKLKVPRDWPEWMHEVSLAATPIKDNGLAAV